MNDPNGMVYYDGEVTTVLPRQVNGIAALSEFQPAANIYELEVVFTLSEEPSNFGLNLCVGGGQKVVVGFDGVTSNLYLDRSSSGLVDLHPNFGNIARTGYSAQGESAEAEDICGSEFD